MKEEKKSEPPTCHSPSPNPDDGGGDDDDADDNEEDDKNEGSAKGRKDEEGEPKDPEQCNVEGLKVKLKERIKWEVHDHRS